MVAIDEPGLLCSLGASKEKELIACFLTQTAPKVAQVALFCSCFPQFKKVDTIPNAVRSQLSTKFFLGSAPAELVRMVFRLLVLGSPARQFEGFIYVDGQLGREPGRYQVPSLGKLENV